MMRLVGGIPAFNEEARIERAVRSLLSQQLPAGASWGTIWVVASGCTDRTADRARGVDPRVVVLEQPERRGKSAALREIFHRADGDVLILLNADAVAEPGSVERLLAATGSLTPPYAVMARPVPEEGPSTPTSRAAALLWAVQDQYFRDTSDQPVATNVHDELLALSIAALPPLPEGIVNDGGFFAAWLAGAHGRTRYVPEAVVRVEIPRRLPDHIEQRRRILWGTDQLRQMFGHGPGTVQRHMLADPGSGLRMVREAIRTSRWSDLTLLGVAEGGARVLASWDRINRRGRDHVRWTTIGG